MTDLDARRAAAVAAVATFATARDVAEGIAARRRGEHPSEMPDDGDALRANLNRAGETAGAGMRRVMRRLVQIDEGFDGGETYDRAGHVADALLTAQRLGRDLHRLHQHLLGLVALGTPVDAPTAEEARRLAADVAALADADALPTEPARLALVGRWQVLAGGLRKVGEGAR